MKVFLVDDEELAIKRLARMLSEREGIEIAGSSTDPVDAIPAIEAARPDLLFLDIEMPGLNGFEVLASLQPQPLVVFTTAYDQYALRAFGENTVDYLLKPVEAAHLARALGKIERIRGGLEPRSDVQALLSQLSAAARQAAPEFPERISSRSGERVEFVELSRVSHFYAKEKLTFAATQAKDYAVDYTIQDLEDKLDPRVFLRIHRATLLNLKYVHELHNWFGGRMMVRLKDEKKTELTVARDRVRVLREKLGL